MESKSVTFSFKINKETMDEIELFSKKTNLSKATLGQMGIGLIILSLRMKEHLLADELGKDLSWFCEMMKKDSANFVSRDIKEVLKYSPIGDIIDVALKQGEIKLQGGFKKIQHE